MVDIRKLYNYLYKSKGKSFLKVKKLKDLFSQFNESLISAGIEAIYIYGSQAHSIESTKEIPIGKEVDLVLVSLSGMVETPRL